MSTSTPTFRRRKRLLIGFTLASLLTCGAFSQRAELKSGDFGTAAVAPPTLTQPPPQTPPAQPTKPNVRYACDWRRAHFNGMEETWLEYTRPLPQGAWLGRMSFKEGRSRPRVHDVQLFAPKALPDVGTEWSLQSTDGKLRCKMTISRGGAEVKIGQCSDRVERYCSDQRIMTLIERMAGPSCQECAGLVVSNDPATDRVRCVTRCMDRLGASQATSPPGAVMGSIQALTIRLAALALVGREVSPEQRAEWRNMITQLGLEEMREHWIGFVNKELGSCTSSHLCPGFTLCSNGKCTDVSKLRN